MIGETTSLPDPPDPKSEQTSLTTTDVATDSDQAQEIGGCDGLDPTRYGDWEKNGRCIDF